MVGGPHTGALDRRDGHRAGPVVFHPTTRRQPPASITIPQPQTSLYSCPCTAGFSHEHPLTTVPVPCEQQPSGLGASFAWKPFRLTHPNTQPTPDIHAFCHSSSSIIPPEPLALVPLRDPDPTTYRLLLPQATISATSYRVRGVHSAPSWPPIPTVIPHVAVSGPSIRFGLTFRLPLHLHYSIKLY